MTRINNSKLRWLMAFGLGGACMLVSFTNKSKKSVPAPRPRIVNIVNFIRLLEPRDSSITGDVLYQTVVKQLAGLKFEEIRAGNETLLEGGAPAITSPAPGKLHIVWPLKPGYGKLIIDMNERQIKLKTQGGKPVNWLLDLIVADKAKLPFVAVSRNRVNCKFEGLDYALTAQKGYFEKSDDSDVFKIYPDNSILVLNLAGLAN